MAQGLDGAEADLDTIKSSEDYVRWQGYAGQIFMFAGSVVPDGWLECDGAEIDRTTYARLFSVLGTSYGSTSGSTFKIPDLRGRVAVCGTSRGTQDGEELHAMSYFALPSHTHSITAVNEAAIGIKNRPFTDWLWHVLSPGSHPLAFTGPLAATTGITT